MICRSNSARKWGRSVSWTLPLLLAAGGLVWSANSGSEPPPTAALYTAAGAVRALAAAPDGRLWAATGGGVLCWAPGGTALPRRWTVADGLDSNDVRAVRIEDHGVSVVTALGQQVIGPDGRVGALPATRTTERLVWDGRRAWAVTPAGLVRQGDGRRLSWPGGASEAEAGNVTGMAEDADGIFLATSLGLWRCANGRWQPIPLPPGSPASHVSVLEVAGGGLVAGLYGDGVYRWDGGWRRLPGQPGACRQPTALARTADGVAVGTQSEGVWRDQGGRWQQAPLPPTLPSADISCLADFQGALWAGTFDSGLLRLADGKARAFTQADGLSSDSPRGLAIFGGALYARYADGHLDASTDGVSWHPAFSKADLPRPEVYALASDGRRLLLGGWAGWAATDGHVWERHYHDPEIQGQVVTAIAAQGDAVWIGTQKRGLLRYADGRYTAYQESQGLTDDWITCLAVSSDRLLVGTYTGGLLEKQGKRFVVRLRPGAFAVRAIAFDPQWGTALAATPLGLYREDAASRWALVDARRSAGTETQAVLPDASGVWVGTRAGLAYLPRSALTEP